MSDQYIVDTPENIGFTYDIAGVASRFVAAVVDTVLILLAQGIILLVGSLAITELELGWSIIQAIAAITGFLILWGYYLLFEMAWNGQTPGKRMVGLRVVREGGRPITFLASAIRNLVRIVDFLPVLYGIGVIAIFVDRRARRLGDLAAGVVVVRERGDITLESLTAKPAAPTLYTPDTSTFPSSLMEKLDEQTINLIGEFLQRREEFGRLARERMANQLAEGLEQRLQMQAGQHKEAFLEWVLASYHAERKQPQPASAAADPIAPRSES
jgi:uncharacterized RDD family membrane protein YckC